MQMCWLKVWVPAFAGMTEKDRNQIYAPTPVPIEHTTPVPPIPQ
jgi:hypothetical protein